MEGTWRDKVANLLPKLKKLDGVPVIRLEDERFGLEPIMDKGIKTCDMHCMTFGILYNKIKNEIEISSNEWRFWAGCNQYKNITGVFFFLISFSAV